MLIVCGLVASAVSIAYAFWKSRAWFEAAGLLSRNTIGNTESFWAWKLLFRIRMRSRLDAGQLAILYMTCLGDREVSGECKAIITRACIHHQMKPEDAVYFSTASVGIQKIGAFSMAVQPHSGML